MKAPQVSRECLHEEQKLREKADALRGNQEPLEYTHGVLGLGFLNAEYQVTTAIRRDLFQVDPTGAHNV